MLEKLQYNWGNDTDVQESKGLVKLNSKKKKA